MNKVPEISEVVDHIQEHYGLDFMQAWQLIMPVERPKQLRDEIAMYAMQSLILKPDSLNQDNWESIAKGAYQLADVMIKTSKE